MSLNSIAIAGMLATALLSVHALAQQAPPEKLQCPLGEKEVGGRCVKRVTAQGAPEGIGGGDPSPSKPIVKCPENTEYRDGKCVPAKK